MNRPRIKDYPETFEGYRDYIDAVIEDGGPYWNNLVGLTLSTAAKKLGTAEANRLIRACGLLGLGWSERTVTA